METSKIAAALAALAMVLAGAVLLASPDGSEAITGDGTQDSPYQLGTATMSAGGSVSLLITVSETSQPGTTSATWTISDSVNGTYGTTSDAGFGISSTGPTDGQYVVAVTAPASLAADATVYLLYTLTTTVDSTDVTQYLYYELGISYAGSTGNLTMSTTLGTAYIGEKYTATPTYQISGTDITNSDYEFYAVGLPSGIAMLSDGSIQGTVTDAVTAGSYSFTVFATDKTTGNVYYGTFSLTVAAQISAFTYTVTGATQTTGYYAAVSNSTVTLTVTAGGSPAQGVSVSVVSDDKSVTALVTDASGQCTLPTTGTGVYLIQMVYKDSSNIYHTDSFYLYVIDDVENVRAGFVLISS